MLRVGDVVSVGVCATRVPIVVVLVFVGALGPRVAVSVAAFVPDVAVASCPAPVVELGCMATAVLIIGGFVGRAGRGVTVGVSSSSTLIAVDVGAFRRASGSARSSLARCQWLCCWMAKP